MFTPGQATLQESFDSEAFSEVVADVPNFADPDSTLQLVVEERVQFDET